ncbi:phosphotransferase family protein [Kribbella hippodromi]|uniref:phosphotransferase family protein n=1 Tax=Kribbella hippodromi TaxID=434347 RepID=UPI0031D8F8C9
MLSDGFLSEQLHAIGYPAAEQLAIGMQGAVFRLGGEKVAKIWFHAGEDELRRLGEVYAALDGRLPFHTPRFLELYRPGPYWLTVERELPGTPLHAAAPAFGEPGWERTRDAVVEVLAELANVEPPHVLHQLTVLDERTPFRPQGETWTDALTALVQRRLHRFGAQLRTVIDDFDAKVEQMVALLADLKAPDPHLVHGDVTAGNILVDENLRPVSVLDFGLLTMPGDPVFDAAAAGSLVELWSPRVREVEAAFDAACIQELGYDAEQLLLYRCIHMLIIANAHDEDPYGRNSGVPLTARLFNSPEVSALLSR